MWYRLAALCFCNILRRYGQGYDESEEEAQQQYMDELAAATVEYEKIRAGVDAKMQRALSNAQAAADARAAAASRQRDGDMREIEPNDPDLQRKERLVSIVEFIESPHASDNLDGLMNLSIFLEENRDSLHWDGLVLLCTELTRFLPHVRDPAVESPDDETLLVWDATCDCIDQMCSQSAFILERVQRLDAVPRILSLLM